MYRRKNIHELNSMKHTGSNVSFGSNPREPGTNSFENVRFCNLNPSNNSKNQDSSSPEKKSLSSPIQTSYSIHKLNVTNLISSSQTGLLDEIYFLLQSHILELSSTQSLQLSVQWYENVDSVLLNEMNTQWGIQADPDGKFCISNDVRNKLNQMWTRKERGWIRSDTDVLVHDCKILDGIREKFESTFESTFDGLKGIGRFGI